MPLFISALVATSAANPIICQIYKEVREVKQVDQNQTLKEWALPITATVGLHALPLAVHGVSVMTETDPVFTPFIPKEDGSVPMLRLASLSELEEQAKSSLAHWKMNGVVDTEIYNFLLQWEAWEIAKEEAKATGKEVDYLRAQEIYNESLHEWAALMKDLAPMATSGSIARDDFLKYMFKKPVGKLRYYVRGHARMNPILNGVGGNCEARTALVTSLLQVLGHSVSGPNLLNQHPLVAIEVFGDHIEPITFDPATDVRERWVDQKTVMGGGAGVLSTAYYFCAFLKKNGDGDDCHADDFWIVQPKVDLDLQFSSNQATNTIMNFPLGGPNFSEAETPEFAISEYAGDVSANPDEESYDPKLCQMSFSDKKKAFISFAPQKSQRISASANYNYGLKYMLEHVCPFGDSTLIILNNAADFAAVMALNTPEEVDHYIFKLVEQEFSKRLAKDKIFERMSRAFPEQLGQNNLPTQEDILILEKFHKDFAAFYDDRTLKDGEERLNGAFHSSRYSGKLKSYITKINEWNKSTKDFALQMAMALETSGTLDDYLKLNKYIFNRAYGHSNSSFSEVAAHALSMKKVDFHELSAAEQSCQQQQLNELRLSGEVICISFNGGQGGCPSLPKKEVKQCLDAGGRQGISPRLPALLSYYSPKRYPCLFTGWNQEVNKAYTQLLSSGTQHFAIELMQAYDVRNIEHVPTAEFSAWEKFLRDNNGDGFKEVYAFYEGEREVVGIFPTYMIPSFIKEYQNEEVKLLTRDVPWQEIYQIITDAKKIHQSSPIFENENRYDSCQSLIISEGKLSD